MASKILRRFQKKVRKVNTTEESAEDFPERSELDDDTEGLSACLSGTLSFGDADVTDEDYAETTATNSEPDFLHSFESDGFEYTENLLGELKPCNMLTKQLQENWKKSRGNLIIEKLIFEVTSANVVHDSSSKYVPSQNKPATWIHKSQQTGDQDPTDTTQCLHHTCNKVGQLR
ncbi:sorting nexin-21 isoform X2 [Cetorhinus maximus]